MKIGILFVVMADSIEEKIHQRIEKLKTRKAYLYFLSHLDYPSKQKKLDEVAINKRLKAIENILPGIRDLIKKMRKFVPHIWDQTKYSAVYLLLGKAFSNLETTIFLAKKGHNLEIVDLARAGTESVDLAFLLFEDDQTHQLTKWFAGKIIQNKKARKAFHRVVKQVVRESTELPVEEMKRKVYETYSLYTHSSYAALLDAIDIFHEDFDFERYAGFHYTRRNAHVIQDLVIKILLQLQNVFGYSNDKKSLAKVDDLLKKAGHVYLSQRKIAEMINMHIK